jgi:hypothetical protein
MARFNLSRTGFIGTDQVPPPKLSNVGFCGELLYLLRAGLSGVGGVEKDSDVKGSESSAFMLPYHCHES